MKVGDIKWTWTYNSDNPHQVEIISFNPRINEVQWEGEYKVKDINTQEEFPVPGIFSCFLTDTLEECVEILYLYYKDKVKNSSNGKDCIPVLRSIERFKRLQKLNEILK